MAGLQMQLEELGSQVTVHLEGDFDARAAVELRKVLQALGTRKAVLDFSRVRTFVDFAVGVLTRELEGLQIEVELEGLPVHHERLFQYLGFCGAKARVRRPGYYQAEELLVS